jgi:hypothetical protein
LYPERLDRPIRFGDLDQNPVGRHLFIASNKNGRPENRPPVWATSNESNPGLPYGTTANSTAGL